MQSSVFILGFVFLSGLISACSGGTKSTGLFNASSYCSTPSCATTSAASSIRISNDSTTLSKASDLQVQIGGVCNPGDNAYNEIHFTIQRTQQTCVAALVETTLDVYGYGNCENGRFYYVIPLTPIRLLGGGCTAGTNVQYTIKAQIYTGSSASSITAGPRYSSDISIQH